MLHIRFFIVMGMFMHSLYAMDEPNLEHLLQEIEPSETRTLGFSLAWTTKKLLEVHNWALKNKPKRLEVLYENVIERYLLARNCNQNYDEFKPIYDSLDLKPDADIYSNGRDAYYDTFCTVLDHYIQVNPKKAAKTATTVLKDLPSRYYYGSGSLPTYPIRLLSILKKGDPTRFESTSKKMVEERLNFFLPLALNHPDLMTTIGDERWNTPSLIKTALQGSPHNSDHNKCDHFNSIVRNGTPEHKALYHKDFQQEILQAFADGLETSIPDYENLFKSPSLNLKRSALITILDYIKKRDGSQNINDVLNQRFKINTIFEYGMVPELDQTTAHHILFTYFDALTPPMRDYGIQKLIVHLALDRCITSYLVQIISRYFNAPEPETVTSSLVRDASAHAQEHKTLSQTQLNWLFSTAQKSGFEQFLEPQDVRAFKTAALFDMQTPLPMRAQFLNELLIAHEDNLSFISESMHQIDDISYPFNEYAQAVMTALDPNVHSTVYWKARTELAKLAEKYPGSLHEDPCCLQYYDKPFVNVIDRWYEIEKLNHIFFENDFQNLQFPEGPYCFGYVYYKSNNDKKHYQLYACDKKTGIPAWSIPFTCKDKHAYTATQDYLYCVTDDGNIAQIDITTGDVKKELGVRNLDNKIETLHALNDETVYAVYDYGITLIDFKTGDFRVLPVPRKQGTTWSAKLIGDRLVIPMKKVFNIIDPNGSRKEIPHFNKCIGIDIYPNSSVGTQEFIVYEMGESLVCLEIEKYKPIWQHPLETKITQMEISPYNNTIFILAKDAVMAVDPYADDEHRLLWRTELDNPNIILREVASIYLSSDGSKLYGLDDYHGHLYTFDINTGKKMLLEEITLPQLSSIRGDYNGKLYIQK